MRPGTSKLRIYDLRLCATGPQVKPGAAVPGANIAGFKLSADISPLFPYINAVDPKAEMFPAPLFIRFPLDNWYCGLYPKNGVATPITDWTQADACTERLIAFLADIDARRDEIVPNPKWFSRGSVPDILRLLPRTNCRDCGFTSCVAFAASLSRRQTGPDQCPHMGVPMAEQAIYPVYDSAGNLMKTVAIDIDAARINQDYRRQSQYVGQLEKELHTLSGHLQENGERANAALPTPLTDRELEVLRMLAGGATNTEISDRLRISPHTVKSHVVHIFNKLGVNDRTQAAVWATRSNLV